MDLDRRQLLTSGTRAALGSLALATTAAPSAQATEAPAVPPLSGQVGLRLCTFVPAGATAARIGIVRDNASVIDLPAELARQGVKPAFDPGSMLSLIAAGDAGLAQVKAVAAATGGAAQPLAGARLLSPIPRPQANIYCVGWNYLDHFEEGKAARVDTAVAEYPKVPVFFSKGTQTMNGPFDAIPYDASYSTAIDWEAELAVIIGRAGRNIAEADAMAHVYGYSAFNDTTARDVQQKRHSGQWFKGKSLDGHGPMGPWLVTAGGLNLDATRIICRVNGVEKQNASYKQMYFKIPAIIAELSRGLTLLPGDIIATGTPSGVGYSRKPPEFLKPGDTMETEITGIGVIRNTIAG
jgi:2-keto-4-pentenoate hydratase/2-oxohepta-3-ene-1,7-dioic acid hydratase in catechol pathway